MLLRLYVQNKLYLSQTLAFTLLAAKHTHWSHLENNIRRALLQEHFLAISTNDLQNSGSQTIDFSVGVVDVLDTHVNTKLDLRNLSVRRLQSTNPPPDTTPPTIAISSNSSKLIVGESALIEFELSESSSDFTLADINVKVVHSLNSRALAPNTPLSSP